MRGTIVFEEQFEMPLGLDSLVDFRRWAVSDGFPERGRVDFIGGRIEVDMSPEELFTHGSVKTEIVIGLGQLVKTARLGRVFTDRTRISAPGADVSAEPDIVFVSEKALDSGTARVVSSGQRADRFIEIEGAPDLIVEIVSDSSVGKDTRRLPAAYFAAGVPEFWLVDARGDRLLFQIHQRGESAFEPVRPTADGFQRSTVCEREFRLDRARDQRGHWTYDLQMRI